MVQPEDGLDVGVPHSVINHPSGGALMFQQKLLGLNVGTWLGELGG